MACAGDPNPLPPEWVAERAARLCAVAETFAQFEKPVYVVGTEVPTPGGAHEGIDSVHVTDFASAQLAWDTNDQAFRAANLDSARHRVIALVVQPGVEFGNDAKIGYRAPNAAHLATFLKEHSDRIFEAHSTDYQRDQAYVELVRDGFAILKVGPQLNFAMREALFALVALEQELIDTDRRSNLPAILETTMLDYTEPWRHRYHGSELKQRFLREHSYSDRIRYFWNFPQVQRAVDILMANLSAQSIPKTLLSDHLPGQYHKVRSDRIQNQPLALVLGKIGDVLETYALAWDPVPA